MNQLTKGILIGVILGIVLGPQIRKLPFVDKIPTA